MLTDFRAFELFTVCLEIGWGLLLLNPWVGIFSTSPSFAGMRQLVPYEWAWGLFFLLFGLFHGALFLSASGRFALLPVFLWVFIVILLLEANPFTTGAVVYSLVAVFNCCAFLRSYLWRRQTARIKGDLRE
jgi:hypothetical protein